MRLWSIHPKYLDSKGLVALWREALLAKAVLEGNTKGYINHPQLDRFRQYEDPIKAINKYLETVYDESLRRGYNFDPGKFMIVQQDISLPVTKGQLDYEFEHLKQKLHKRSPEHEPLIRAVKVPGPHPIFKEKAGGIEPWEKILSDRK